MKIWKIASTALALGLSTGSQAAILSYGGYTHDTTTDIVTGNGLEWLQWDVTVGESINSITPQLDTLAGGGWSIASNVHVAQLFNAFDFGITFDTDENTSQSHGTGYSPTEDPNETDRLFIGMFGDTYAATGNSYCYGGECYADSSAIFGTDIDGDSRVNSAFVADDYVNRSGYQEDGTARLLADGYDQSQTNPRFGVALVRDVSPVPVPAAVWLFGSGLIGLVGVARRKKA